MGKKIDVRIMKLNKWYVPKSVDLANQTNPVILGCFDELEVHGLQVDAEKDKMHPFLAGYRQQIKEKSIQKQELVDFSSQEQILFLNICEEDTVDGTGFTKKTIHEFWSYRNSSYPYLYLTMIHINHSNNLNQTLRKIKRVFGDNYLSYTSYDYCDIVLFAQNLSISDYLEKIRHLFQSGHEGKTSIFDTFSMVCFHPKYAYGQSDTNTQKKYDENDSFQATININVRDHKKFKQWYQDNIQEQSPSSVWYYIYGRHDISITNEDANTGWLMRIMDMLHDDDNQKIFWTFETFIKVKGRQDMDMESDTSNYLDSTYKQVRDNLKDKIDGLKKAIDNSRLQGQDRYILPIYEVRDCLCGIVKNSFAEEFICCIYESFLHFVTYMTTEINNLNAKSDNHNRRKRENVSNEPNDWEDQIAECYDKYFVALNTLVNSTMHNERQFVQATAFNAVFYSVPPKIMAFYNAYIYRVKQILIDQKCNNQYTILIYPSFSPTITLEQISLDEAPPCDRMLTVKISEESLYDIESVMYQLVHELAHQVGTGLRCRKERTQQIDDILLKWIVDCCGIENDTYQILRRKIKKKSEKSEATNSHEKEYLQYIFPRGMMLLRGLASYQNFGKTSVEYFLDKINADETYSDSLLESCGIRKEDQRAYVENYGEQYDELKCTEFKARLRRINNHKHEIEYKRYIDVILWVYHECYADLQMILVLAMNAEDYLNTFLIGQKLSIKKLLSQPRDLLRICTIFRVMTDCDLWQAPTEQDNEGYRLVYKLFSEYNNKVASNTDANRMRESERKATERVKNAKAFNFENGIRLKECLSDEHITSIRKAAQEPMANPLYELAAGLYEYLLIVMEESLKEYSTVDKLSKIRDVRQLIKKILAFEDAIEIFNCVEAELGYYKQKGCKIDPP